MDASCRVQENIHLFSLVQYYVSRILGTYYMPRQTLFISYCWEDGTEYAEELEAQLSDRFIVKRAKSLLKINDDVYAFMKGI